MKRILASLAALAVVASLVGAAQAPKAEAGYATFQSPRLVATFMTTWLNTRSEGYSGVHATEVNRYRITLKGTYEGYMPFTAYFTKAGRQTIKVTLNVYGQHMSRNVNVGFDA